jgi:flavin reductase (DIM6/NTAB) family NADH-FMN oxidoreductase RutF
MALIQQSDLIGMERFYRANLINGISGFKPAALIGTRSPRGNSNLAMFSSIIHLGADPALIAFIQRPVGVSGDTYRNILSSGVYTINLVTASILEKAHYTSAKFDPEISEFSTCALTEEWIEGFDAPGVKECPIKFGLRLVEEIPIKHNNTKMMIGSIQWLQLNDGLLENDGNVNLNRAEILAVSGLENYHLPKHLRSLPYARATELPVFTNP